MSSACRSRLRYTSHCWYGIFNRQLQKLSCDTMWPWIHMVVSKNGGTPKIPMVLGYLMVAPILGNLHILLRFASCAHERSLVLMTLTPRYWWVPSTPPVVIRHISCQFLCRSTRLEFRWWGARHGITQHDTARQVLKFLAGGFGDPWDSGCRFGFGAIAAIATVQRLGFVQ